MESSEGSVPQQPEEYAVSAPSTMPEGGAASAVLAHPGSRGSLMHNDSRNLLYLIIIWLSQPAIPFGRGISLADKGF